MATNPRGWLMDVLIIHMKLCVRSLLCNTESTNELAAVNILQAASSLSHKNVALRARISLIKMNYETHETRISRAHLSTWARGWAAVTHNSQLDANVGSGRHFLSAFLSFRAIKIAENFFWNVLELPHKGLRRCASSLEWNLWTFRIAVQSNFRTYFHPGQNKCFNDFMKWRL